jgi:hypothetical protein
MACSAVNFAFTFLRKPTQMKLLALEKPRGITKY